MLLQALLGLEDGGPHGRARRVGHVVNNLLSGPPDQGGPHPAAEALHARLDSYHDREADPRLVHLGDQVGGGLRRVRVAEGQVDVEVYHALYCVRGSQLLTGPGTLRWGPAQAKYARGPWGHPKGSVVEGLLLHLEAARRSNWCSLYEACPAGGVALNIDGYQARESMYPFLTPEIWGWRAAVGSAMDVVATGARPMVVMASVGAPSWPFIQRVIAGVAWAARYMGAAEGKHDSNRSGPGEEWIDVAVLGELGGEPIPRAAPRGRYLLVQAGYAGYGAVERALAGSGGLPEPWVAKRKPPLEAWRALQACGAAAAMDNSDGYLYTVRLMAALSRLDVEITGPPLVDPRLRLDPWDALGSWEDYNLLVLAGPEEAECLLGELEKAGIPAGIVGEAGPGRGRVSAPVEGAGGFERGWLGP